MGAATPERSRVGKIVRTRCPRGGASADDFAHPTSLFPEVLEVTYGCRAKYTFTDCDDVFPGPLDSPNWPAAADYGLGKFVY